MADVGDRARCEACGRTVRLTLGRPTFYGRSRRWVGHGRYCTQRAVAGAAPATTEERRDA